MTFMDFMKRTLKTMNMHPDLKTCSKGIVIPKDAPHPWIIFKGDVGSRTINLELYFWALETTLYPLTYLEKICIEILEKNYSLKINKKELPTPHAQGGLASKIYLTLLKGH